MQKTLTSILFMLLCSIIAVGQITITNSSFPAAGDTLRTTLDLFPSATITMTAPGVDLEWDYTDLNQGNITENIIRNASEGTVPDAFPGAELVQSYLGDSEGYVNVTATKYEIVGYKGPDPAGIGLDLTVDLSPAIIERYAPLSFLSNFNADAAILLPLSTAIIPDSLLASVPLLSGIDSLRIKVAIARNEIVDGWGHIKIPGGEYDVLRMKRFEERETRLEIKSFLGWLDVTDLAAGALGNFLGIDTVFTYNFYAAAAKEPIMVATMDNAGATVQRVEFKYLYVDPSATEELIDLEALQISPNPSTGDVRFSWNNTPNVATLTVTDLNGKNIWTNNVNGQTTANANLADVANGTYICTLKNTQGRTIATTKLLLLK